MIIVSDGANLLNYTGPGHVLNDEIDRRKARAACQDRATLRGLKKYLSQHRIQVTISGSIPVLIKDFLIGFHYS